MILWTRPQHMQYVRNFREGQEKHLNTIANSEYVLCSSDIENIFFCAGKFAVNWTQHLIYKE